MALIAKIWYVKRKGIHSQCLYSLDTPCVKLCEPWVHWTLFNIQIWSWYILEVMSLPVDCVLCAINLKRAHSSYFAWFHTFYVWLLAGSTQSTGSGIPSNLEVGQKLVWHRMGSVYVMKSMQCWFCLQPCCTIWNTIQFCKSLAFATQDDRN